MAGVPLHQQIPDIAVELHVPALIRSHRNGVGILLDRGLHDVEPGPVMPEMDHLGSRGLKNPPENVYRGVMAVKKGGRGDETDPVGRAGMLWEAVSHALLQGLVQTVPLDSDDFPVSTRCEDH